MTGTVEQARIWIKRKLEAGEAVPCPCCGQRCQLYKRQIHRTMARDLVGCYRLHSQNVFHLPTAITQLQSPSHGDTAKLAYWGLMAEVDTATPETGGRTAGYWQITPEGEAFVHGTLGVPKYALVFNRRLYGLEGPRIYIADALGHPFDFHELMAS